MSRRQERRHIKAHFLAAREKHVAGELPQAVSNYREAIRVNPSHGEAQFYLGTALMEMGSLAEALEAFQTAKSLLPNSAAVTFNLAFSLEQMGRIEDAICAYRASLDLDADDVKSRYNLARLLALGGQLAEAEIELKRVLSVQGDLFPAHRELGALLARQGRWEAAAHAYRMAIGLNGSDGRTFAALGLVLLRIDSLHDARDAFQRAANLLPHDGRIAFHLGETFAREGRFQDAAAWYQRAITKAPDFLTAREHLVDALHRAGRHDLAKRELECWMQEHPDNTAAAHLLAACGETDVPPRANDAYIQVTFDRFAGTFDETLDSLKYRVPIMIAAAVEEIADPNLKQLDVLDAGCGTGLCGQHLAPYARRLVGVDLSTGMVERARVKNVYDHLAVSELAAYLQANPGQFDLIVAADTLVYFGELEPAFAAAWHSIRASGWLIFTLEQGLENGDSLGYRLHHHGRYSHKESYVFSALGSAGWQVRQFRKVELREEAGIPVTGYLVTAGKVSGELAGNSKLASPSSSGHPI